MNNARPLAYAWSFPLPRTHTGMLLGNGVLGAMVWGEGQTLRITLGRADYWDHRGGMPWTEQQSYANIRGALERNDEAELRRLFERTGEKPGEPARPSVLPIGMVEFDLGRGTRLETGVLDLRRGCIRLTLRRARRALTALVTLDLTRPVVALEWPAGLKPAVKPRPAWENVGKQLEKVSFQPPLLFAEGSLAGWTQMRPADPPLCVACRSEGRAAVLTAVYGPDAAAARREAEAALAAAARAGAAGTVRRNAAWLRRYWKDVPDLRLPNERLQFLHDYGMFKFAGLTHPDGVAATLQGPWVEEYQMPPWSNDYHFNINVQMCYWPAYHGNRLEHLKPLFERIRSWEPTLRHNAKVFLGIEDGLMLPHAVDDRCVCMGGFWTGSIDHGCTAWVGQMMYRYYRYTRDTAFLRDTALPFMRGAMRVYQGMLEKRDGRWCLPVSVSPEYRGASMNAWGRNASFQLACVHRLAEDLQDAARELGEAPDPSWAEILAELPKASLHGDAGREQIALWDGTVLEESHRHHSHLAGLTPFDVMDFESEPWRSIVHRSIAHWIYKGAGLWSGWCVPWASMIHTRLGNADAAELWLEIWERVFTNEGHGTLHDVNFSGFSLMGKGATCSAVTRGEIMQMDAGMSCIAAVHEMLLHERRGVNYLFRGAPARWADVSFRGMRTGGAFLVSAARRGGEVGPVKIQSLAGGPLCLANPWPDRAVTVTRGQRRTVVRGAVLEIAARRNETLILRPAATPP